MRSNFKVGKTIAGFAFTVGRHDASQSRLLIDTFSKTKERAEEKLKDRKSTRLNSSHVKRSRMPSSA